jgi:hypothetical protein
MNIRVMIGISRYVAVAIERIVARIAKSRIIHAISLDNSHYSASVLINLSALLFGRLCSDSLSSAELTLPSRLWLPCDMVSAFMMVLLFWFIFDADVVGK